MPAFTQAQLDDLCRLLDEGHSQATAFAAAAASYESTLKAELQSSLLLTTIEKAAETIGYQLVERQQRPSQQFSKGDRVLYRGAWGKYPPQAGVITGSSIMDYGSSKGERIYDVDLDNGKPHWGYADQFEAEPTDAKPIGEVAATVVTKLADRFACCHCGARFGSAEARHQHIRDNHGMEAVAVS